MNRRRLYNGRKNIFNNCRSYRRAKTFQSNDYRMIREGIPYTQFDRDKQFNLDEVKAWVETR